MGMVTVWCTRQKEMESIKEPQASDIVDWFEQFHIGDAVELMNKMPRESVGCIVTSPPYNLSNTTGSIKSVFCKNSTWENAPLRNGYTNHNDSMPYEEYVKWQRECLTAMMRVLRDDGAIFYNHKSRVQNGLLQDRYSILEGFPVRQCIIWHRTGGINYGEGFFLPTYEVIYLICKPNFKLTPTARRQGDVWRINQARENSHPAPFPAQLAKRCIESTTAEIILDPFMGSGTTAVAAEVLERDWIGIDTSKEYCELATERIRLLKVHLAKR